MNQETHQFNKAKKYPFKKRYNKDNKDSSTNKSDTANLSKPKSNIITIKVNHQKKSTYNADHPYAVDCTWADLSSESPSPSPTPTRTFKTPANNSELFDQVSVRINGEATSRSVDFDPKTPAPILKTESYGPAETFLGSFHPNMNLIVSPFNFSCPVQTASCNVK